MRKRAYAKTKTQISFGVTANEVGNHNVGFLMTQLILCLFTIDNLLKGTEEMRKCSLLIYTEQEKDLKTLAGRMRRIMLSI